MIDIQKAFLDFCKKETQKFEPTEAQQRAIFDEINIVSAGAGSGKTAVLSHRFLYLVMNGLHSDEILTITFTKDATANMKKKIYQLLKRAVDEGIIDKGELDRFSSSTITTTDGFCSEIAKSGSSEYGISAKFQIELDDEQQLVSDALVEQLLKQHQDDAMLSKLLDVWSIDNLKQFYFELQKNYLAVSRYMDFSKYKETVQAKYSAYNSQGLENLLNEFLDYSEGLPKPSKTMLENTATIKAYQNEDCIENLISLTKIKSNVAEEIKPVVNEIKEYAQSYLAIHPDSLALLDYIAELCRDYQNSIFKHKRETGCVTYRDVLLMAIDILKNKSDIRGYYQTKFKAIMVDEFQDNNNDNKTLVELIAGSHKERIFMVGDEKQSIYKFRNADVSVFKSMIATYGESSLVQLQQNYRSEKKLIDVLNDIFEGVFEGASKSYEAEYTSLESNNEHVQPSVALYYNKEEGSKASKDSEANNIADVIEKILTTEKSNYQVYDKNGVRDPQPSDIAILLKVGTHQIFYEKALRNKKIPFDAIENKSLTLDAIANDFYNILQLAIWGQKDEIAWYGLKNSPFGNNKTDEELELLVRDVRTKISCSKIAEVVSYLWNNLGYRFFILRNANNHQYEEHLDFLFALAVNFDQQEKTIIEFLDYLRPMLGDECKIKNVEIQRETESGVKIMSIHKSKGLEFPIVIIPDMNAGGSSGGFKANIRAEGEGVSFPYAYTYGTNKITISNPCMDKDEEADMEIAETKRVLYVAATRAQYHLVFSGLVKQKKDGDFGNSMMGCLLRALKFGTEQQYDKIKYISYDSKSLDDEESVVNTVADDSWYEKTYDFKYRKLTAAITSLDIDKETSFNNPLRLFESDKLIESWTEFGTYVHAILERAVRGLDTDNYYGSYVDHPNKEVIHRDAMTMRDNFINSDFFKRLANYEKFTERGFFYYDQTSGDVMEGVVDLLCVSDEKIVIVDYKTDKFKDSSTHKGQLDTYVRAMSEKYKRPVKSYLFYVRSAEEEQI